MPLNKNRRIPYDLFYYKYLLFETGNFIFLKDIYLVLVYDITEHPMMLATNKEICSKEDVIKVAKIYFSRWRIEKYFCCKKQMFQLENFRVRKQASINALNFYITLCMAFLTHISMKSETNALKVSIIKTAAPIKEKMYFCYYRLAKGICGICHMRKRVSGSGSGQSIQLTVNSALS